MILSLLDILKILGSIAFFIYSTRMLTNGMQKALGTELRKLLATVTSNRFLGVFAGFFVTMMVQSSSATTVMVVSYVNAGIISFTQSLGVVMGANIGTTSTGWLLSVLGFHLNIVSWILPIIAVAIPFLFAKKASIRALSEIILGFALLFLSLEAIQISLPILAAHSSFFNYLGFYDELGIFSTLLYLLCGTVLTLLCRSSSAAMAITMVAAFEGWLGFEAAAGVILGENIGTTVTANLAALKASTYARRTAFAHFVFNVFGIFWMMLLFSPFVQWVSEWTNVLIGSNPLKESTATPIALSLFHTSFNLINMLLLVGFIKPLENITKKVVSRSKPEHDADVLHLELLSAGIAGSPELSMDEAQKEVVKFGKSTQGMIEPLQDMLYEQDDDRVQYLVKKIANLERNSDRREEELVKFLVKVSEGSMSENASQRMRAMLSVIGDIERIGDIVYQMAKTLESKNLDKAWFTPKQRNNLNEMLDLLHDAMQEMNNNLVKKSDQINLVKAVDLENKINKLRDKLKADHLKNIDKKGSNIRSGFLYVDLYSSGERLGDVIMSINDTLKITPN